MIPNFCREDLSYFDRTANIGVPMISFCDIPLTRATMFKARYGGRNNGGSNSIYCSI